MFESLVDVSKVGADSNSSKGSSSPVSAKKADTQTDSEGQKTKIWSKVHRLQLGDFQMRFFERSFTHSLCLMWIMFFQHYPFLTELTRRIQMKLSAGLS